MYWRRIYVVRTAAEGPFEMLDVTDAKKMHSLAKDFGADTMMHMAALLSAKAEEEPIICLEFKYGWTDECT